MSIDDASLRERPPVEGALDLARVLEFYLHGRSASDSVLLIGYSRGADVLPFMVNRLPSALRARVAAVTLIAPGRGSRVPDSVADWLSHRRTAAAGLPLLCLYGEGDGESLCPQISPSLAKSMQIGSGHHLGGDYETIAGHILMFAESQWK